MSAKQACAAQRTGEEQLQAELKELAKKISASLSTVDAACRKELLSDFVSDLFLSAAEQQRREERRQRQAEGIAEAKARGVRFGRPAPPVPDTFDEYHQAWRDGKMSLRQAAAACGMPQSSFHSMAVRKEQTAAQRMEPPDEFKEINHAVHYPHAR